MQNKVLKTFLMLLFFHCATFVYSDVLLDNLVMDLESWLKAKDKVRIDFGESKYSRSAVKDKKIEKYQSSVLSLRVLIAQMFLADLTRNKPIKTAYYAAPSIKVNQFYKSLKAFKESGSSFKSGDVVFFCTSSPFSAKIATLTHSDYSHAGMLWVKDNEDIFIVHVDPSMDLQIVKLFDYLTASFPNLINFAVYRSVKNIDEKDANYLFKEIENNKDTILFDPYYVNNPGIRIPEKYFSQYPHFYCTELIYLFYAYLLRTKDFITTEHLSSKAMIKNFTVTSLQVDSFLDSMDSIDNKNKQFIILPNNFIFSKFFKQVYYIKAESKE